jgi:Caspase domain
VKQFSVVLDKYSCSNKRRGRCIIINNHHFNKQLTRQNDRDGTDVDAAAVQKVFKSLGFDVTRYDDLTVTDMSINLREGNFVQQKGDICCC